MTIDLFGAGLIINLAIVAFMAISGGFAVPMVERLVRHKDRAGQWPGGSMITGFALGLGARGGAVPVIVGVVCGVMGWMGYRLLLHKPPMKVAGEPE